MKRVWTFLRQSHPSSKSSTGYCRLLYRRSGLNRSHCVRVFTSPTHNLRFARHLSTIDTCPTATGVKDLDFEKRNFQLRVPEYYNFASDVIDAWALTEQSSSVRGSNPAFWWIDDFGNELKWTFRELSANSKRVANLLEGPCRLSADDRALVILPRIPTWWLVNIACIRTGTVLIPGTTQLTATDIKKRLQASRAKCVIADEVTAEKVDQVVDDCPHVTVKVLVADAEAKSRTGWLNYTDLYRAASPSHQCARTKSNQPMTIFFTSGTTGDPKMTEHTHASYGLAHQITGRYWLDLVESDVHWSVSDTGWAKAAWSNLFAPWIQGACVFIHHSDQFDPAAVLKNLDKYPISTLCTVPTAYRMMINTDLTKYRLQSLRHCVSAGEPLNPEVTEQWLAGTGHVIREGYGQTETVLLCASYRCIPNKPGSIGKPPPGMDVRIIDDNGNELGPGEEGSIALKVKPNRPVGLFTGYINEPERTADAFVGDYYNTGDRAYVDEDGYFWFVGRSDDVIISGAYRIGPFEVENALIEHPAVAESAVVSSPDDVRGQVVKAFVILTEAYKDADPTQLISELQNHVKNITAPYKYPRKIDFVESLPKTVSLKIRRVELRNREWGFSMSNEKGRGTTKYLY